MSRVRLDGRSAWAVGLVSIFAVALGLRAWSIGHGLPWSFNVDERTHFIPIAIRTATSGWNPDYFQNPPAFGYLLRIVFEAGWGKEGLVRQWASDPAPMLLAARWTSAVLGSLACVVIALAGRRLFGRLAGLTAGLVLACSFVPVFYGHLALNDSPLLLPMALALCGTAGILRSGRRTDYLIAGAAAGLATATKYTAGIVAIAAVLAFAVRRRDGAMNLGLLLLSAVAAFLIANPYSLLDHSAFIEGLTSQHDLSSLSAGKFGQSSNGGIPYYLGALGLGTGWLPLAAAAAGAVLLTIRERGTALVLLVPPLVCLVYMSTFERWFARWAMPMIPFACLLAGFACSEAVKAASSRWRPGPLPIASVLIVLLVGQGLVLSARADAVLGRPDTRQILRDWMTANVPRGSKVVTEAFALPDSWYLNPVWAKPQLAGPTGPIWLTLRELASGLAPEAIERHREAGWCTVIVSSNSRGRAEATPGKAPDALAYYRSLDRQSRRIFSASPWKPGKKPGFDFDSSYLYFDGSAERPGPFVEVRRLDRCVDRTAPGVG